MESTSRSASTPSLKARKSRESLPRIVGSLKKSKSCSNIEWTSSGNVAVSTKLVEIHGHAVKTKKHGKTQNAKGDALEFSQMVSNFMDEITEEEKCADDTMETLRGSPECATTCVRKSAKLCLKERPKSARSASTPTKKCPKESPNLASCARTPSKQRSKSEPRDQEFQKPLAATWPRLPSPVMDHMLQRQKEQKLRVAILNVCRRQSPHPAALSCLVALTQTPWFHSKTVARFLNMPQAPGKRLSYLSPMQVVMLQAADIRSGLLGGQQAFDIIVVPGGSAKTDLRVLGKEGCEAIQDFVRAGGGYCGICAGAFLGLRHLKLVHANLISTQSEDKAEDEDEDDIKEIGTWHSGTKSFKISLKDGNIRYSQHRSSGVLSRDESSEWLEGRLGKGSIRLRLIASGQLESSFKPDGKSDWQTPVVASRKESREAFRVDARFTKLGRRLLWSEGSPQRAEEEEAEDGTISMRYHNGPLMEIPKGSAACALCHMWPSKESTKAPPAMGGAVAIVMQDYGGGRAIMISPHPESTPEAGFDPEPGKIRLRRVLQRAVLLAAGGTNAYSWIRKHYYSPNVASEGVNDVNLL